MQALIDKINAIVSNIKSGIATREELEEFVSSSSELHDLAVVLRYKAYEALVYGEKQFSEETRELEKEQASPIQHEVETETAEETLDEGGFDLFSLDNEQIEEKPKEESVFFVPQNEETGSEILTSKEEIEDTKEEKLLKTESFNSGESSTNLHPIFNKINQFNNTLTNKLMSSHIDSLNGAFSFNERLQIIQELFGGSGDEFTDLIDEIETISNLDQARNKLSNSANKHQWNEESSIAIEFIQKIERKYV